MTTPKIISIDTRAALNERAAVAGEIVARRLFAARGNNSEVHLSELELAMVAATAAAVAMNSFQVVARKEGEL